MKISILLPYKENFSLDKAGAVSIYVKDISTKSKYKKSIKIYGDTFSKKKLLKNFTHLNTKGKVFLSKTNAYINEFLKYETKKNSDIIEIHNRPLYINSIKKITKSKIVIYFHNDPLSMKGSSTIKERYNLIKNTDKIIFNSHWCKNRFLENLNLNNNYENLLVIQQSTSQVNINFNKKKKIISFIGKLNSSKGYDVFGKAIINILNKYPDWKSIVIGDEPREKYIFKHPRLKIYGFKSNKFILNKLKYTSISVVPSRWNEPFGRSSLEASSRGCALIISNKGGLTETTKNALIIKEVNEKHIYNNIKKLITNKKLRINLQKKTYKHFYLTNDYITNKIDIVRNELILNNKNNLSTDIKNLKILHITNLNERFDGRLHYNTGKRITNGFIRLGHNVLTFSDRDIISKNRTVTDFSGIKTLNKKIINTHKNFKADLVVLGHADNITDETIYELKKINHCKICQWFLDPVTKKGPDYEKNKQRIKSLDTLLDATFITTHPGGIDFKINNSYFMPNPCDKSFETLNNFKETKSRDLFFAMSHGVHRGILKEGKQDDREHFLKKLKKKLTDIKFDIYGMDQIQPVWGEQFIKTLSNYNMALNLSRGKPAKYYSSDRIVQLIGNGLLTFIDEKTKLNKIISSKGVVYYKNINDLVKKIAYFKKNQKKLKEKASFGKNEYFKKFNSNIISEYIIENTLKVESKKKYSWN